MKELGTIAILLILAVTTARAVELPRVPTVAEATGYVRLQPVFKETVITRERGDALLKLLDGGRTLDKWMKGGFPAGVVCVLPIRPSVRLAVSRGERAKPYEIGVTFNGGLLYLPEGLFEVREALRPSVAKWVTELEHELNRELTAAPKPLSYAVGVGSDGGTFSGLARLFYGDAAKWKLIFDANRATIKDPNVIREGMKLLIPKDSAKAK